MTDTRTESREVAHHEPPPPSEGARMLQMVVDAAKDPAIDAGNDAKATNAGKMKALVDLTTGLQDRERESEFNRSLVAAQLEMPVISRDGIITIPAKDGRPARTQGRFAKWEDIDRVIRPILAKYGLALRFEIGNAENSAVTVRPILAHRNGFTERGEAMKLPADTSGSKNATQASGSSVAYGKRYTACGMLNIVTEGVDEDGAGGVLISLPYEREQVVRSEAEAAHSAGTYQQFFDRQSPKDRAWLFGSGLHDQYGGRALPAPASKGKATKARPEPELEPEPEVKSKPQTPREWVDRLKADMIKCQSVDFLNEYMDGKRDALDKLKEAQPDLWDESQAAYQARKAAIEDGRLV